MVIGSEKMSQICKGGIMKQHLLITILTIVLISRLAAVPHILVDAIHGWASPPDNIATISDPAELFPDYDFDYLSVSDINIENILVSGNLSVAQDTVTFTVPDDAPVLYLRYEPADSLDLQHPYFYLIDPTGEFAASSCDRLTYVEEPMSGEWTLVYSAWDALGTWYEVGTGPHFYTEALLEQYDLILQMVDNTFALFLGTLPELTPFEITQLTAFFEQNGGYLLLRETDMTMVDKPIIHLTANRDIPVELTLNFPGVPTFMEPPASLAGRGQQTGLSWRADLRPDEQYELLYEGRPPGSLDLLTMEIRGERVRVSDQADLNLNAIRVFQYDPGLGFRYGTCSSLAPGQSTWITTDQVFTPLAFSRFLQTELEQEALANGLSQSESSSFFKNYQWINRLITRASSTGAPCAIYNFSGADYDRFIPLTSSHEFTERIRIMWVFAGNVPEQRMNPQPNPVPPVQSAADLPRGATLSFHEYGVIEELHPLQQANRELTLFDLRLRDEFLVDETDNNDGNSWNPTFHTFGDQPLAQLLTTGVNEIYGSISAPIVIEPNGPGLVVVSGDDDTYGDGGNEFPPGSFPPVAVAESIADGWLIAVNDINILNAQADNRQFLQNCFEFLANSDSLLTAVMPEPRLPSEFKLYQNYPNPFNPETDIRYDLPRASAVTLTIYSIKGEIVRKIHEPWQSAGIHELRWNGSSQNGSPVSSGIYIGCFQAGSWLGTIKMVHLK
jgi:hypothetical protein